MTVNGNASIRTTSSFSSYKVTLGGSMIVNAIYPGIQLYGNITENLNVGVFLPTVSTLKGKQLHIQWS